MPLKNVTNLIYYELYKICIEKIKIKFKEAWNGRFKYKKTMVPLSKNDQTCSTQ